MNFKQIQSKPSYNYAILRVRDKFNKKGTDEKLKFDTDIDNILFRREVYLSTYKPLCSYLWL